MRDIIFKYFINKKVAIVLLLVVFSPVVYLRIYAPFSGTLLGAFLYIIIGPYYLLSYEIPTEIHMILDINTGIEFPVSLYMYLLAVLIAGAYTIARERLHVEWKSPDNSP